ncbi:MAG: 3'-5' exonuclease [Bacillota bacterium]|jgi:DNA polymerase-3 subunit epsilon
MLDSLFEQFDNILVCDVETTGLDPRQEEIIELAVLHLVPGRDRPVEKAAFDAFIRLSPGKRLPPEITGLTGITEQRLLDEGLSKEAACEKLTAMLESPNPLFVAYNAQFDLCFLYYFLHRLGRADALKNIKMLDALTVYRDRREYPHRLSDAVAAYTLETQNTHRAIDDAEAALALLYAMEKERDDLARYINLFGYNPKYGVSGQRISSVTYLPQKFSGLKKLYDR